MAWYSLGKGDFVILDGGLRVGGAQFKENSKLDLLVKSALKCGAEIPPGDEASVWEGLTFHWSLQQEAVVGRDAGRLGIGAENVRNIRVADKLPLDKPPRTGVYYL